MSYVVPTIKERGWLVRAIAQAMHEAGEAMKGGARDGRLVCSCGGKIQWSGNGTRSAGSCLNPACRVRWATQ